MNEQELRRLSRKELLEMLIQQSELVLALQEELADLKAQLAQRTIDIEESGSLAEAALKLNGVFQAAEAAAAQYLENIRSRAESGKEPTPEEAPRQDEADPSVALDLPAELDDADEMDIPAEPEDQAEDISLTEE